MKKQRSWHKHLTCSNDWQHSGSMLQRSAVVGGPTQFDCIYSWRQLTPTPNTTSCLQLQRYRTSVS